MDTSSSCFHSVSSKRVYIMSILKNRRNYKGLGRYIGRPSLLGNPIASGKVCQECGKIHYEPGDTIPCYIKYFKHRVQYDPYFFTNAKALLESSDIIICWCTPNPCHGNVLLDWQKQGYPRDFTPRYVHD